MPCVPPKGECSPTASIGVPVGKARAVEAERMRERYRKCIVIRENRLREIGEGSEVMRVAEKTRCFEDLIPFHRRDLYRRESTLEV